MKNYIVVTGGAGFVGSNLIKNLLKKTKKTIISLDDYSSGYQRNHVRNKRIIYIKGNTVDIKKKLIKFEKKIHSLFHFGEFSRIYQSFEKFHKCLESNTNGTNQVFKFCLQNKIKLIYSATSASFGKNKNNKNLSPYAFSKSKNLEFLENLKKWFNFKYEVIYFYNVYGYGQIKKGNMATVIGVFEDQYANKKPLTVVKPGNQTRRFTHINDTINVCYEAWKNNKCAHYSISNLKSYSILQVAKMFKSRIKMVRSRKGERYASALTKFSLNNRIIRKYGKIDLKDYISSFIKG